MTQLSRSGWYTGLMIGVTVAGCGLDALYRTTASLGGDIAGQRGNAEVVFINNTPYRAIFTFGAYDDLDRNTQPILTQSGSTQNTLEGNSQLDPIQVQCSRVFSVGGAGLIRRVRENLDADDYNEDLLLDGAGFSSAPDDDPLADEPTEGVAPPLDAYLGVDFTCGSVVIIRFEINDLGPDPFQITLSAIPADSTRG